MCVVWLESKKCEGTGSHWGTILEKHNDREATVKMRIQLTVDQAAYSE